MQLSKAQVIAFQNEIMDWYAQHKRDLPWRHTRDPYRILISEVMSQQTQIGRVVSKYTSWIVRFPTLADVAKAPVSDLLSFWSGLGYNKRVLNLKKTAAIILSDYAGVFPQTEKELLKMPGIGRYTARALLCFAFDKQVCVVDTNVRRVIIICILRSQKGLDKKSHRQKNEEDQELVNNIAEQLLPAGRAYEWNQALMDYASVMLQNEKIVIPKQSRFLGSHRYYRGQIIKALVRQKQITVFDLGPMIKKDFGVSDRPWLKNLVMQLQTEGFIEVLNDQVMLIQS